MRYAYSLSHDNADEPISMHATFQNATNQLDKILLEAGEIFEIKINDIHAHRGRLLAKATIRDKWNDFKTLRIQRWELRT